MSEPFSLDIKGRSPRLSDSDRFVIWVLWVIGYSASSIAAVTGLPRKRVLNCANHSPFSNRSGMSDAERRGNLEDLKAVRFENGQPIDGGKLDRIRWEIMPLTGRKVRPGKAKAA